MWNNGGMTRFVVKTEHALWLGTISMVVGLFITFFSGLIQAGYSDTATAIAIDFLQLCGQIPWWVGLIFIGFGIAISMMVGGKGE
jgi:nicotinamide riboside transporter PnuC